LLPHYRRRIQIVLLLLAVVAALSATGIVFAQASQNYDLGCWAILSSGGGTTYTNNYTIVSAMGQWYGPAIVTATTNPTYTLSSGYIQDWDLLDGPPTPGASPPPPGQFIQAYLPWVSQFVQTLRTCPNEG
jgi:hypothetical protein